MIIYRPHKGKLEESLAEAQTFNTVEEMFDYIKSDDLTMAVIEEFSSRRNKLVPKYMDMELAIDEDEVIFDKRCGWNTMHVLSYGNCIGMCDLNWTGDVKKNES